MAKKIILLTSVILLGLGFWYYKTQPKQNLESWMVPESSKPITLIFNGSKLPQFEELICYTFSLPLKPVKVPVKSQTKITLPQGLNQPNFCLLQKNDEWYRVVWQLPINDFTGNKTKLQAFSSQQEENWFANFIVDEITKTVIWEQNTTNYEPGLYSGPKLQGKWFFKSLNTGLIDHKGLKKSSTDYHTKDEAEVYINDWAGIAQEKNINSVLINLWRHQNAYENCGPNRTGLSKSHFASLGIPLNGNFEEELVPFNYIDSFKEYTFNEDHFTSPQATAIVDLPDCKFNLDRQEFLCSKKKLNHGDLCSNAESKFNYNLCNIYFLYSKIKPQLPVGTCIPRLFIDYTKDTAIGQYPPVTAEEQNSINRLTLFNQKSGAFSVEYTIYLPLVEDNKTNICAMQYVQYVTFNQTVDNKYLLLLDRHVYMHPKSNKVCQNKLDYFLEVNGLYQIFSIIGLDSKIN